LIESRSRFSSLIEQGLFGKPLHIPAFAGTGFFRIML